jgi:energy-coupling factor transporter ATP-binding protein EcfA2
LIAGLHVGGGLARGARVLIIGPSGVGKSSLITALRSALERCEYRLPFIATDAIELSSPGWSGAPSVGDLLDTAFGKQSPSSPRARHAVVVIDEIHHANVPPGLHGNMRAKRQEVLASLLAIVGYGTVPLGESTREWSSHNALVIALGAFTGLLDTTKAPTPADLVAAGIQFELATRFEQVLVLRPLSDDQLRRLLREWPALVSLVETCERLGYAVRIHEEAYARAARAVIAAGDEATPRTAGGWLVTALRSALSGALNDASITELEITPDSLSIARSSSRHRNGDDPPGDAGGWDTAIVLSPR